MLQAISILHGGEPISASEVGHGDGIKLQIVCPFCREPLFYVSEFTRGTTLVKPHFSHYKGISADAAGCEARSLTPEGREEIKRLATKARNQRLKLFQRRFWQCCKQSIKLTRYTEEQLDAGIDDEVQKVARDISSVLDDFKWHKNWKYNAEAVKKSMDLAVDHLTPKLVDEIREPCQMTDTEYNFFKSFTEQVDARFQKMVVNEASIFLGTTAGAPILKRLSEIATITLVNYYWEETEEALRQMMVFKNPSDYCGLLVRQISVILATVPWRTMLD